MIHEPQSENPAFLSEQIITYIGNKRLLIGKIEDEVLKIADELGKGIPGKGLSGKEKLICADLFSGSGIVTRMLKAHSSHLIVNDLENYSTVINSCYLSNKKDYPQHECEEIRNNIIEDCEKNRIPGIITQNYAPKNDNDIKAGERVFYTHENALLIDTYRNLIDKYLPETQASQNGQNCCAQNDLRKFFLAPLITEASIHVNTSGVFKGFYKDKNTGIGCFGASGKNALTRILGKIELKAPVFSNFEAEFTVYQKDAVELAKSNELPELDVAYLDPPYNQHPYGSNYFMLNLILKNKLDVEISEVSGITQDWNRSEFNKAVTALSSLEQIVANLKAKYIIISYNSEGFINFEQMKSMLSKDGTLKTVEIEYITFRGSRNLNARSIHVSEYLFVLKK